MVNSFDSVSRHLFRFLFAFVVVVAATNVAANSTSEDGTDDLLSLFFCEEIEPFWTAAPYNYSVMYENGDTKILEVAQANLTITEQNGCSATGISSWTDGKNEKGGEELVAISIIPPKSNNDKVEMIMMEIGDHPVNGTNAFIKAVVTDDTANTDDGTKAMHWIYEGRSNDEIAGSNYATVFDATYYEGSVPDSVEDEMGNNPANDCVDISGMWTADPFTYFKMYQDGDQPIDIMGPTSLVWNLTQNGCQVHGINNWDNGKYSGLDYLVGAVTGSNVILTEVKHGDHADGHFRAIVSDDGRSMSNSFIGLTNDYTMAFDTIMARGDTVPNVDQRSCDVDLVGTWTSIQDVVTIENMDAGGESSSTTFPEVNLIIDGQSENGCEFWGSSDILSFNFGGVVMPDTPDGTTSFALATQRKDDNSKGISNAHLIKNDDDSDDDDGHNNLLSFTELSRSQDATSGTYFTTIFQKQSMNVTASDTPPPPVVVVAGNTNVENETGSDELVLDDADNVPPPTTTTDDSGNVPPTTTTDDAGNVPPTTTDDSSSDASASATPSLSQVYTTTTIVVINLLVAVSTVVVSVIY